MALVAAGVLLLVASVSGDIRVGGRRTLVITQDVSIQQSHSMFFTALEGMGHQLDFHLATERRVLLQRYGEWMYDNVVLFAPSSEQLGGPTVDDYVDFLDGGGNILAAASGSVSQALTDLAGECGVEYDEPGSAVIDHFSYDVSDPASEHTLVVTSNVIDSPRVAGSVTKGDRILFQGIGQAVDSENILTVPVLRAEPTAYSAFPDEGIKDYPQSAGTDTLLVTSVQARNNARATFAGSLFMFSNAAFTATARVPADGAKEGISTGNAALCAAVAQWTFQGAGVLRVVRVAHARADGTSADHQLQNQEGENLPRSMFPYPEIAPQSLVYRIKDELVYTITVQEYTGERWEPFEADDMQLEFVMLDPYVRQTLVAGPGKGDFTAKFTAPDVYGIYKFRVLYRRLGLSTVDSSTQVSVRPFRHNEYERFIECAFPYYASAFSMMAGVFVFSLVFLYSK